MRHCVHDRERNGCTECDRVLLEQRTAAMVVLGLDAEDLDVLERVRKLRRIAGDDTPAPDGQRATDRLAGHVQQLERLAEGHRARLARTGGSTRELHEQSARSWSTEGELVGGLLELLGHRSSVTRKRGGDEA